MICLDMKVTDKYYIAKVSNNYGILTVKANITYHKRYINIKLT